MYTLRRRCAECKDVLTFYYSEFMFDFRHRCWRRFAKQGCLRLGLCTNRLLLDEVCYTHTNILMPSRKSTKVTAVYKNAFVKSQQNVRLKSITSVQNLLCSNITPHRPVSVSPPGEKKKLFHVMFADSYEVETRRSRVCLCISRYNNRGSLLTLREFIFLPLRQLDVSSRFLSLSSF